MKNLILIVITTALINNVVLNQFLGICSFLGVSQQMKASASLGAAVIFVMTIAVPQFVSLMIVSKMLTAGDSMEMSGIITQILYKLFGFQLKFGINITHTRIAIILVNMWIGIPYSMLICSGILMNIPILMNMLQESLSTYLVGGGF